MRTLSLSLVPAVSLLLGCADANPNAQGGEPLLSTPDTGATAPAPAEDAGPPTWSALYESVFTACGNAACHGSAGGGSGYWVCGASSSDCYSGLVGASGGILGPIVPTGGASDATTTQLYKALHRPDCSPTGLACNMPLVGATPTAGQMTQIVTWIQSGAPNN